MGLSVGDSVGEAVGDFVGEAVGASDVVNKSAFSPLLVYTVIFPYQFIRESYSFCGVIYLHTPLFESTRR